MDYIGCTKTGSSKTLTYAFPILQKLCEDPYGIFALIVTPTRELAFQLDNPCVHIDCGEQFAVLGGAINLRLCVVTGGMDMVTQAKELSAKSHVVVATPGRLADHL